MLKLLSFHSGKKKRGLLWYQSRHKSIILQVRHDRVCAESQSQQQASLCYVGRVFSLFIHDVFGVVLNCNQLKSVLLILESCKHTHPYLVYTEIPLCSFITRHYNYWWLCSVLLNSKGDIAFATKTKAQALAGGTLSLPRFLPFLVLWPHATVTPSVKR